MICYDTIWYDMIWYDMIWYDMIWYDMIWYDIWYDMIWYDMIWYDMIWFAGCDKNPCHLHALRAHCHGNHSLTPLNLVRLFSSFSDQFLDLSMAFSYDSLFGFVNVDVYMFLFISCYIKAWFSYVGKILYSRRFQLSPTVPDIADFRNIITGILFSWFVPDYRRQSVKSSQVGKIEDDREAPNWPIVWDFSDIWEPGLRYGANNFADETDPRAVNVLENEKLHLSADCITASACQTRQMEVPLV